MLNLRLVNFKVKLMVRIHYKGEHSSIWNYLWSARKWCHLSLWRELDVMSLKGLKATHPALTSLAARPPPFVTIISTSGLTTFFRAGSLTGPLVAPNPALNDSGKLWAGSLGSWATQIAVKSHTGYKNEFIFIRKTQKHEKISMFQTGPEPDAKGEHSS